MPCRICKLEFREKNLNLDWDLNHGSPDRWSGALNHGSNPGPGSNFQEKSNL